jgi:hypothetical protein
MDYSYQHGLFIPTWTIHTDMDYSDRLDQKLFWILMLRFLRSFLREPQHETSASPPINGGLYEIVVDDADAGSALKPQHQV